jgi:hypothetical protein
VYDPHTNAWTQGRPLPTGVKARWAIAVADRLALFDAIGDDVANGWVATAIYDPQKGEWTMPPAAQASLHTKSLFGDGLVLGDKLYVFLFAEALAAKNSGRVWAFGTDGAWNEVAQHPIPPNAATLLYDGAVVSGNAYIVGVSTMIAPH